jgi:murein L,D-transpeptidase YcbB/YkuD
MKSFGFLFLLLTLLSACETTDKNIDTYLTDASIPQEEKLQRYLQDSKRLNPKITLQEKTWLNQFYSSRDFKPVFISDKKNQPTNATYLEQLTQRNLAFGVPNEILLSKDSSLHPIEQEVVQMVNILRTINAVKNGFLLNDTTLNTAFDPPQNDHIKFFLSNKSPSEKDLFLMQLGPVSDTNYQQFATGLYEFVTAYRMDTAALIQQKTETEMDFAKRSLSAKGYLKGQSFTEQALFAAIRKFKQHNGLGNSVDIDSYTLEALAESNTHRCTRAAICLDKIRRTKWPKSDYVKVNIPEYRLYYHANDSLKAIHNVVVGKRTNETPELVSSIRNIVLYPYWKVPSSIIKKEIMPEAKKNLAYLKRHHYKLCKYDDTTAIDFRKVNLKKSSGYSVIQYPGPWNSLGVIKFEFNNQYSVYLHDTPQKGFFSHPVRSYSHGCMRCQNPVDLVKKVLEYDQEDMKKKKITADSIDSWLTTVYNRNIPLYHPIPVHVIYQSVIVFQKTLVFCNDIYGREQKIMNVLTKYQQQKLTV